MTPEDALAHLSRELGMALEFSAHGLAGGQRGAEVAARDIAYVAQELFGQ